MVSAPTMEAGQGPDNYPDNIISYFNANGSVDGERLYIQEQPRLGWHP